MIAEAAFWFLLSLSALRLLVRQPVRRELRAHPGRAAVTGLAIGLFAANARWLMHTVPLARYALLAVLVLILLFLWIRARPGYGVSRGLPPGSLGVSESLDALDDEEFYANAASRFGPVFKMSQFHRPVVCITDLSTGGTLLKTYGNALAQSEWGYNALVPGGYVEFMNGAAHSQMRTTLAPGFSGEVLAAARPDIQGAVNSALMGMEEASRAHAMVDPRPFMDRVAFQSVVRVVLGVSAGSTRCAHLLRSFAALGAPLDSVLPPPARVKTTFVELTRYVRELVEEAGQERVPLSTLGRLEAAQLRDPTVVGNLVLLVSNGGEILSRFLLWTIKRIAEQSAWVNAYRTGSDAGSDSAATEATWFVMEELRLNGSPYVYRVLTRDCQFGEWRLPKGWLLRLCVREAHLSSHMFENPRTFDPCRFRHPNGRGSGYSPFGPSDHACLGDTLVTEVARALVATAALNFSMRLVADGPAERGNRHWSFWRPSRDLRVHLSPRG